MSDTSSTANLPAEIDPDSLRAVRSFEELANLAGGLEQIQGISDLLGDGFTLLDKQGKKRLVGVPFVILEMRFNSKIDNPENIGDFWSMAVMTNDEKKFIVNDGSTGIAAQLEQLHDLIEKGEARLPIFVRRGLRVSDYTYTDPSTGESTPAETVYLNTDAASM